MRVVESPKSTSGTCVHLHFLSSVFKPCARLAMVVVGLTVTLFAHHLHLHYAFKKNPLSNDGRRNYNLLEVSTPCISGASTSERAD